MEAFIPPGSTSFLRTARPSLRFSRLSPTPSPVVTSSPLLPQRRLAMLAKRAKPPPSTAPSGPSDRDAAKISSILKESGFSPRTATTDLEERFNRPPSSSDAPGPTLYERVAGLVGADTLAAAEKRVGVALVAFALLFVACGVAISVEAYVKVTGGTLVAGEGVDGLVVALAEKVFTPALLAFLAVSSAYGVLKSSQLGSGTGIYEEPTSKRERGDRGVVGAKSKASKSRKGGKKGK